MYVILPDPYVGMDLDTQCVRHQIIASHESTMGTLRSSFLGSIAEVCIVSGDHKKTMNGLLQLGIGPFQVFDFTPTTVPERYFRGQAGTFELKVCFAKYAGLTFEIMQPTGGESLMAEYLDQVSEAVLQ